MQHTVAIRFVSEQIENDIQYFWKIQEDGLNF